MFPCPTLEAFAAILAILAKKSDRDFGDERRGSFDISGDRLNTPDGTQNPVGFTPREGSTPSSGTKFLTRSDAQSFLLIRIAELQLAEPAPTTFSKTMCIRLITIVYCAVYSRLRF